MTPDQAKEIWSYLKKMEVGMLTTRHPDGRFHSRPMHHVDQEFSGTLYFFTGLDTDKVSDIKQDDFVCLSYADHGKEDYLCITGHARVTQDRALIDKYWSPFNNAWFDGKDDPNVALLEIKVDTAELWDTTSNRMVQMFEFAKASLTGGKPDVGEYKKIA